MSDTGTNLCSCSFCSSREYLWVVTWKIFRADISTLEKSWICVQCSIVWDGKRSAQPFKFRSAIYYFNGKNAHAFNIFVSLIRSLLKITLIYKISKNPKTKQKKPQTPKTTTKNHQKTPKPKTKKVSQVGSELAKIWDQYSPFLPHFNLKDALKGWDSLSLVSIKVS